VRKGKGSSSFFMVIQGAGVVCFDWDRKGKKEGGGLKGALRRFVWGWVKDGGGFPFYLCGKIRVNARRGGKGLGGGKREK